MCQVCNQRKGRACFECVIDWVDRLGNVIKNEWINEWMNEWMNIITSNIDKKCIFECLISRYQNIIDTLHLYAWKDTHMTHKAAYLSQTKKNSENFDYFRYLVTEDNFSIWSMQEVPIRNDHFFIKIYTKHSQCNSYRRESGLGYLSSNPKRYCLHLHIALIHLLWFSSVLPTAMGK